MDKLSKAREGINKIDGQIAALWQERMDYARLVLEHKLENNLPVFDAAREREVIQKNSGLIENESMRPLYAEFLQGVMDNSKKYQRMLLCKNAVGYQGTEGAFSHIALNNLFGNVQSKAYQTFAEVFEAVEKNEVCMGVIPFENSYTGEVGEVLDLLFSSNVSIIEVYDLPIDQNLLGLKGAGIGDIKKIYSHPQAIGQCAEYLKNRDVEVVPYPNTALSARLVSESGDKSMAAIASRQTASLYGLDILAENINTRRDNTTRFVVISKTPAQNGTHFSLIFSVRHETGALASAMQIFARHGFNLECIKSRPIKEKPWEYYFYALVSGDVSSERAKALLGEMSLKCERLKLLGTFTVKEEKR